MKLGPALLGHWRAALLVVAVLVVGAACSDDGDRDARPVGALDRIREATFAGGTAAYVGETRFADGTSGPVDGRSRAVPPTGEVSHPVRTESGLQEVTFLWVDSSIYTRRAVTTDAAAVSATLRLESDPPWSEAVYQPLGTVLFDAYDPFLLLDRLAVLDVSAEQQGTEALGEDELERYVVDMAGVATSPGGAGTIELFTDADDRLQQVRLVGRDTIEYRITEYGIDVSPSAPPEDQVGTSLRPPSVVPVGPFETVAEGTGTAGAWQLLRAPGTDGGTCWRMETDAPLDAVATTQADGVTCISAFEPDGLSDDQVQVVVDAGTATPFDALVAAVAPGSTQAQIQLADGTTQSLAIEPGGFVVWVGPKAPPAVVLEVTAPNGELVTCGPGVVSSLADYEELPLSERETLDRAPWLCLAL